MPQKQKTILQAKSILKKFPGVIALKNVDLELYAGEIYSLCGENGAGKSTLIKILSGIYPAGSYQGDLFLDQKKMSFQNLKDAEKSGIAVIYQELALVEEMTVAENIFLGSEPSSWGLINWDHIYQQAQKVLEQFGLSIDPSAKLGSLGVGQQQLVEIVKALRKNSRILILDEPTSALSETEVAILLQILLDLRKKGISCIYISHKLDEVFAISDRITVLRDGESIVTLEAKKTSKEEIIRHMVGREITNLFPREKSPLGGILLEAKNLYVLDNRGEEILKNISFQVRSGEVLGLGGLMGAGRTELLMHIFGAAGQRKSGSIFLQEEELKNHNPAQSIKKGLVLVSEDRKIYGLVLEQSIGFNMSLSSLEQFSFRGFINQDQEFQKNQEYFQFLQVKAPGLDSFVETLSGGNQQKVVLGKALMTNPKVVFLDEPTRGIDVGAKLEVYHLMNRLTSEGYAVVLVSSELPELMGMSDRIIMLSEGRIGGTFTQAEATQEKLIAAAMEQKEPIEDAK